ncbi:MAG TPA: alpha/beta hydrolase fold domain-containing protein, partial [Gemmatimonadaceae bacterium]|nr:alpha/beta hydrolase fold domain-containing protein [Gemmatimonadaceae bacterium]
EVHLARGWRITRGVRRGLTMLLVCAPLAVAQQAPRTFKFKQTAQGPLDLIVDYPADWRAADTRSAIVLFFGGAWASGSVEQFSRQALYFVSRGMVSIRPDYRTASRHHTEPDSAVEDARSAVRWVRTHAHELGIDPNRIVAAGGSSGGHLAACTVQCAPTANDDSSVSSRPNALVLFNPVVDIGVLAQLPAPFPSFLQAFPLLASDTALQERISPLAHTKRGDPPALLMFGTRDPLFASGKLYADRLTAAGVRVDIFTAEGVGHGFFNRSPWYERTLHRADEFLSSLGYVSGKPSIVAP